MNGQTVENKPESEETPQITVSLTAEEYKSLREEILKRMELRYQVVNLTLISAGVILTAGLQQGAPSAVLLVYPILGAFLANAWVDNVLATLRIAQYVREEIEAKNDGAGWETYLKKTYPIPGYAFGRLGYRSTVGIFLSIQVITWLLGNVRSTGSTEEILLLVVGVIAGIYTLYLVLVRLRVQR